LGEHELSEIRTARLTLLPLGAEHADELVGVLGDPALHTFIGGRPETLDELRVRYARWAAGSPDPEVRWLNWAIRFDTAERLVGTVQATVTGTQAGTGDAGAGAGAQGKAGTRSAQGKAGAEGAGAQGTVAGARAEVAWVVGTGWQGRGFATEAARGLVAWLLSVEVGTVVAHVHPDNVASARVARALGLRATGQKQDDEDEWLHTVGN
jgi:RimJ/RimL family protein N-acetyltransferase